MPDNNNSGTPLLGTIGGAVGLASNLWNFGKDLFNLDGQRALAQQKDLLALQQQYYKENAAMANQYNIAMFDRQRKQAFDMFDAQSTFANLSMDKQFRQNAILSDQGRAVAQQRAAGLNPSAGDARPSGSVAMPSTPSGGSIPGGSMSPSSPSPGSATVSHYVADMNSLIESGLKLDNIMSELSKRKSEVRQQLNQEKISKTEADKREEVLDAGIEATKTNAEATWLNAQTNAGMKHVEEVYKEAMVKVEQTKNKLQERGIKINEAKLQYEIKDIIADIHKKDEEARKAGKEADLTYKEYLNYEKKLEHALDAQDAQAASNKAHADYTQKDVDYYELKMFGDILRDVLSVAKPGTPLKVGSSTRTTRNKNTTYTE